MMAPAGAGGQGPSRSVRVPAAAIIAGVNDHDRRTRPGPPAAGLASEQLSSEAQFESADSESLRTSRSKFKARFMLPCQCVT